MLLLHADSLLYMESGVSVTPFYRPLWNANCLWQHLHGACEDTDIMRALLHEWKAACHSFASRNCETSEVLMQQQAELALTNWAPF